MFTKIILHNFKSFEYVEVDLMETKTKPTNAIFIYGENGSGKSNLVSSFAFLKRLLHTFNMRNRKDAFLSDVANQFSEKISDAVVERYIRELFSMSSPKEIADEYHMIDSIGEMSAYFEFQLYDKVGSYLVKFDEDNNLIEETLNYLISQRVGELFSIKRDKDRIDASFSTSFFSNSEYEAEIRKETRKYWGMHTLLAIFCEELTKKNHEYIVDSVNENFFSALDFFQDFTVLCNEGSKKKIGYAKSSSEILSSIDGGTIPLSKEKELQAVEKALNDYFVRLYSDIQSVEYIKKEVKQGIEYELYFNKLISGKIRKVPVSKESTGTMAVLENFPYLYEASKGNTVIIDEIDTGIHDMLMSEIVGDVVENMEGQLIVTTHNTLLMGKVSPKNVYILNTDREGNAHFNNIPQITSNNQVTHNNSKRYLDHHFGGVPRPTTIDFHEISQILKSRIEEE